MSNPYIGEIRMFAGNFVPLNWHFCDGTMLPIAGNETLYQLIGTTYGGNGVNTFMLPDLRSRVPMHQGGANPLGQAAGSENITLTVAQMASHTHQMNATATNQVLSPTNALPAIPTSTHSGEIDMYGPAVSAPSNLNAASVQPNGGSQPHNNIQPYLAINFIISMAGIYPNQ